MKKRILLSLVLVCILTFTAGLGTYAYFSATAESRGNTFEMGRLTMNNTTYTDIGKLFELESLTDQVCYPGLVLNSKTITLQNTGDMGIKLFLDGEWKLETPSEGVTLDIDKFMIKPTLETYTSTYIEKFPGLPPIEKKNYIDTFKGDWMTITQFETWVNGNFKEAFQRTGIFPVDHKVDLKFDIKLSEQAENEYQLAKLRADVKIIGYQEDMPSSEIYK